MVTSGIPGYSLVSNHVFAKRARRAKNKREAPFGSFSFIYNVDTDKDQTTSLLKVSTMTLGIVLASTSTKKMRHFASFIIVKVCDTLITKPVYADDVFFSKSYRIKSHLKIPSSPFPGTGACVL